MTLFRSLVFNIVFYVLTALLVLVSLPIFMFGSERAGAWIMYQWGTLGIYLLRVIAGTKLVVRGLENIPEGGAIFASKHQSMFETFALFPVLERPTYVMKRELARIPLWGWYARRGGMVTVARDQNTTALRKLAVDVQKAVASNRQVVIFPEGTRTPPGTSDNYKGGIAHLYRLIGAPVVPMALNSGIFWPRRKFLRYPGNIVIEFLPPIEPGLTSKVFRKRLIDHIEAGADRLLVEASETVPPPPFPAQAAARLGELRRG